MLKSARYSSRRIALGGLALILAATLFPFHFSSNNFVSFSHSFRLSSEIARRGTDLLIGLDGAFHQPFKGKIDGLRIYSRKLSPTEIGQAAMMNAAAPAEALGLHYKFDEGF